MKVTSRFIEKWSLTYLEEVDPDDSWKYSELVERTASEFGDKGTLSVKLCKDIAKWKSDMVLWKLDDAGIRELRKGIREFPGKNDVYRLSRLLDIRGIALPVASTYLHFLYPDLFPIIDARVLRTLEGFRLLNIRGRANLGKDMCKYWKYVEAINRILASNPRCTIRKLDMALFAYDYMTKEAIR